MGAESAALLARLVRGGARATRIIANDLLGEAVQAAPVEEGTLRASGHIVFVVNGREFSADEFEMAVAHAVSLGEGLVTFYGEVRFSTPYAAAQHEGIALMTRGDATWLWQARNYPKGGGPKYLERPLMTKAPRYQAALAKSIDPMLGGRAT